MINYKIRLSQAKIFHGHLGPYLVLGLLMGELALNRLRVRKYFGLSVRVKGAKHKPKSCLIDGLQLSTGCTFGKGNIRKLDGKVIKVDFIDKINKQRISIGLKKDIINTLRETTTHRDSENLARRLYKTEPSKIFNLRLKTNNE